jgi:molecular chaperone GrpE
MSDTNVSSPASESAEKAPLGERETDELTPAADSNRVRETDAGSPGEPEGPGVCEADAASRVARLEEDLRAANDRFLRARAELENYRKRVQREMNEERRYAALPLIRDLLEVVDHLELAIEAANKNENASGLLEGVKMVAAQLQSLLGQHHCRPVEAEGRPFDPHFHQAVGHEPSRDEPAGQITRVARAGYQLHDRVIRPSQVYVSSGQPDPNPPTTRE